MKYKVGDRVTVVSSEMQHLIGQSGVITDVDEEYIFPYEVKFDDDSLNGVSMVTLFAEDDISPEHRVVMMPAIEMGTPILDEQSFINIKFQEGTVKDNGINGVQIEDVIDVLVERLQGFQQGNFACRENALAITHLQEAQNWLYRRTMLRSKQGVEGKGENHES